MANTYFLMMALLELIPSISDSNGAPVMLVPLTFVVMISMIKDILEDVSRHKSDNIENLRFSHVWFPETNKFEKVRWR
jgi:phospholipid-transporting ATPase